MEWLEIEGVYVVWGGVDDGRGAGSCGGGAFRDFWAALQYLKQRMEDQPCAK
jgi:hypothetical protein